MILTTSILVVCLTLSLVLSWIFLKGSQAKANNQNSTSFECGFNPIGLNLIPFSSQFFLVAALFLLFDIEITIITPSLISPSPSPSLMLWSSLFITILTVALMIEWMFGMIEWSK